MSEKNQRVDTLIHSSIEKLGAFADVNMIIGKPIVTASGFQLIPFSKVTFGNLSGGGEYGDVKVVKETDSFPTIHICAAKTAMPKFYQQRKRA